MDFFAEHSRQIITALTLFPLGACVGSFLNVVIYRLPLDKSLLSPPSHCPHCGKSINPSDNIPIIGWLLLRGKARCCGKKISGRYPFLEALTGTLWALTGWVNAKPVYNPYIDAGLLTVWLLLIAAMIAASYIDIDHQIIPDAITLGGLFFSLLACLALPQLHTDIVVAFPSVNPRLSSLLGGALGAATGAGVCYLLSVAGALAMREKIKQLQEDDPEIDTAIGLGDVKLMAFLGALFGWKSSLMIFFMGAFLGALFGIIEKIRTGRHLAQTCPPEYGFWQRIRWRWGNGVSVIPFGPYLCAGALAMMFFKGALFSALYSWFFPFATRHF